MTTINSTTWKDQYELGDYSLITPINITDEAGTNLTDGSGTIITTSDSSFTPIASTTWLDSQGV